ncbi:MAG: hypothetical protein L0Z50_25995, partial [Verrucomicrobiales bacterium]|nr:hypothetical protein [Verrucomicrobiales bacterium]
PGSVFRIGRCVGTIRRNNRSPVTNGPASNPLAESTTKICGEGVIASDALSVRIWPAAVRAQETPPARCHRW